MNTQFKSYKFSTESLSLYALRVRNCATILLEGLIEIRERLGGVEIMANQLASIFVQPKRHSQLPVELSKVSCSCKSTIFTPGLEHGKTSQSYVICSKTLLWM